MIEIVNAYTRSGNEWCTCCQKQTNTKRIKFSYDGRQGNSVVLCDDCRRELAQVIGAIPIPDGATNGDLLLELLAGQHDKIHPVGDTQMGITLDCEWWNALYKKEV